MREGYLEVLIVDGARTAKEFKFAGKTAAEATAGSEFTVEVIVHKDDRGNYPFEHVVLDTYIDGSCAMCPQLLSLHKFLDKPFATTTIRGYNYGARAFTFGTLNDGTDRSGGSGGSLSGEVGTVKVALFEGFFDASQLSRTISLLGPFELQNNAVSAQTPNKKFWQMPSLTAVVGRVLSDAPVTTSKYCRLRPNEPDAVVTLAYHSKQMIKNLKTIHAGPPVAKNNSKQKGNAKKRKATAVKKEENNHTNSSNTAVSAGKRTLEHDTDDDDDNDDGDNEVFPIEVSSSSSSNKRKAAEIVDLVDCGSEFSGGGGLVDLTAEEE